MKESLASVTALLEDAKGRGNLEWLSTAQKLRDIIQEEKMKTELKQKRIKFNDFFYTIEQVIFLIKIMLSKRFN